MDAIDQKIVALMREDARRSFKDIGKRVSLSAPAVKRRVDRLQSEGVIKGYTTTVDHSAFGWNERIRETDGVLRTHTQIVLSTLLERPVAENGQPASEPARTGP